MAELKIHKYSTLSGDIVTIPCGSFDVTHSSGILYHLPSPMEYLTALRRITLEYCILTSASVPRKVENEYGILDLSGGKVLYVPIMSDEEKRIYGKFYSGDDGAVVFGANNQDRFSRTNYVPWWWILTGEAIASMCRSAGWEVVEMSENWGGRAHTFLLKNTGRFDGVTVG